MSHIRSKDTRPEMIVRQFLFAQGYRYRLHVKRLPGTPDIVMRRLGICIFVNGCFWHGHMLQDNTTGEKTPCKYFVMPKSRREFWETKISRNQERDKSQRDQLQSLGWKVLDIWECELKPAERDTTLHRLLGEIQQRDINYLRFNLHKSYQEYSEEDMSQVAEDEE